MGVCKHYFEKKLRRITFIRKIFMKNHVEKSYVQITHFGRENEIFQKLIFLETALKMVCLVKVRIRTYH